MVCAVSGPTGCGFGDRAWAFQNSRRQPRGSATWPAHGPSVTSAASSAILCAVDEVPYDRNPRWTVLRQLRRLQRGVVVLFVLRGEFLNVVVALGVSVFCFGFILLLRKVVPGNIAPRAEFDDEGTTFRPDRGVEIPIQIALVGAVLASAVYMIFAPPGYGDHIAVLVRASRRHASAGHRLDLRVPDVSGRVDRRSPLPSTSRSSLPSSTVKDCRGPRRHFV